MIQSKIFEKVRGNDESKPLAECYKWALAHCMQTPEEAPDADLPPADSDSDEDASEKKAKCPPKDEVVTPMIVVVQQYGDSNPKTPVFRRYVASTLPSFMNFYTRLGGDDASRHIDEVIGLGICKAFCDFELALDEESLTKKGITKTPELIAALDESSLKLIDSIVEYHQQQGVTVRPFITVSHKETKWSRHVVFVNSLWRSALHFGAYMKRLKQRLMMTDKLVAHYVDLQVYGRFRCLRMNRSSKLKEPARSLLNVDRGGRLLETAKAPIDPKIFIDSLVTVMQIRIPGMPLEEEPVPLTTAFFEQFPEMVDQLGLQPLTSPDLAISRVGNGRMSSTSAHMNEEELIEAGIASPIDSEFKKLFRLSFSHTLPYQFTWLDRDGIVRVQCNSRHCVILGATHESNHIFVEVDVLRQLWRYCCHSERCRRTPTQWRALSEDIAEKCKEFAPNWRFLRCFAGLARATTRQDE
jgi:hypothetical protein